MVPASAPVRVIAAAPGQVPVGEGREPTTQNVLRALRLVFSSVQKHNQWIEQRCGIGGAQLWALWEVAETQDLRVSDLARRLSIHQSTASNLLDKLTNQGLVRRERSGPDQRVVYLRLTEKGRELISAAPRPAQNVIIDALQQIPDEALQQLDAGLAVLVQHLKVKDKSAEMKSLYDL